MQANANWCLFYLTVLHYRLKICILWPHATDMVSITRNATNIFISYATFLFFNIVAPAGSEHHTVLIYSR